jgi:DNA adenine methylase
MGSALHRALDGVFGAHDVGAERDVVEKTMWGSPAGKKRIAERLAKMLPAHSTYVEPFAGSAAVLFAKQPSDLEVINDADSDIARAYKVAQKLDAKALDQLRKKSWVGNETTFHRLYESTPSDDVSFLYKFLYTTHFSYGKMRGKSFSPSSKGIEAKTVGRIEKFAPRLARVKVMSGDYERVVRKYDGKKTAMFLDPPYAGYDARVGESKFDEQRFFTMLKGIKGSWVLTYGIRGELPKLLKSEGYDVRTIRTRRSIGSMRGVGGPSVLTQLLATNFTSRDKALAELASDDLVIEPFGAVDTNVEKQRFDRTARLVKGASASDERFVLGVVLEPETVDSQGDIYSADEIRHAAHLFMEEFGALGLMHQLRVDGQVKVLESYLAPDDVQIGDAVIKRGTWLLGVRVLSDDLWAAVRDGTITGFSIGGFARRVPTGTSEEAA